MVATGGHAFGGVRYATRGISSGALTAAEGHLINLGPLVDTAAGIGAFVCAGITLSTRAVIIEGVVLDTHNPLFRSSSPSRLEQMHIPKPLWYL